MAEAPPGIARVTAPILFGPMINWALYGVLCVQTYVYSYNFIDDRRLLKLLVYFVFLLETVQTALTGADVYYWFMAGFGDLEGLKESRFSPIDVPTMDAFISLIAQVFFCYRIWVLNKRLWWLCIVVVVLSIAQATGALWGGLKSASPHMEIVDILIAVTMTFLLRQGRDNENRCSRYFLPRIVRLTVETNTLTATVAIISFALYVGFPNDIYYACPTAIIGKLYSNTILVTLNNRIYFHNYPTHGGSGAGMYLGPSGHSSHHHPKVEPPGVVTANGTIALNSFSSAADLEKAKNIVSNPGLNPGPSF